MVSTYAIRDDVIWPTDLALPTRPPRLVYLDMLVFINLAKVPVGTSPPGYGPLLEACQRAHDDGRALFPLSSTHVMEVLNIRSVGQRRALVAVMGELSHFSYLLGRPQIQQLEVEGALNEIPGVSIAPQDAPIPLIGPRHPRDLSVKRLLLCGVPRLCVRHRGCGGVSSRGECRRGGCPGRVVLGDGCRRRCDVGCRRPVHRGCW